MMLPTLLSAVAASAAPASMADILADPAHAAAPGCVAGAFRDGAMVAQAASGYADLADQIPLDGETLFYGASLSKQFTALAAATLIADGRLSLDDDVRKYLPELPAYRATVTVGMLMHHSAGIRDSLSLLRLAGMADVGRASKDQALRLLFRQSDTAFVPGTSYSYSNGGYLLLAEIVERVSGRPFADYARRAIFAPLGMKRSYFLDGKAGGPRAAHGYVPDAGKFVVRDTFPRFSGSGGLMISLNDLARFERDIERGHRVWTPAVAKIMLAPGRLATGARIDDGKGMGYGGGLHIGRRRGQWFVQHGGAAEAFKHVYARLPERHEAYVLLCNRGDWNAQEKIDQVMMASGVPLATVARAAPSGRFRSRELDAEYSLAMDGTQLTVTISSPLLASPRVERFTPAEDGSYVAGPTRMTFGDGSDHIVVARGGSGGIRFSRIEGGQD
ncbi:CubicO group peptidase, beta-lactamase class C family [Sphingomonas laterariae]|uniref:CubicO group peptidase, beta-lactamase class C family n=1 Tax=Edaphosphingomonas laterariae TaxID=861865 RepID=A0A239DQ46_9SPHN|nr:serine hydrolase domain-containing protein [Sphingomonas laterariae]SNS33724.1 CubicO group peptidase, beta-lactamase class C family [Sphingomonas laterariae]